MINTYNNIITITYYPVTVYIREIMQHGWSTVNGGMTNGKNYCVKKNYIHNLALSILILYHINHRVVKITMVVII